MMTSDLKAMLDVCSLNLTATGVMLIAADAAADAEEPKLEWVLRWIVAAQDTRLEGLLAKPVVPTIRQMLFTGSRCYGTPHEGSDWDWVIRIGSWKRKELEAMADTKQDKDNPGYPDGGYRGDNRLDCALRFGPLNLICVSTKLQMETWERGTHNLLMRAPVTRKQAVDCFTEEFARQLLEHRAEMDLEEAHAYA